MDDGLNALESQLREAARSGGIHNAPERVEALHKLAEIRKFAAEEANARHVARGTLAAILGPTVAAMGLVVAIVFQTIELRNQSERLATQAAEATELRPSSRHYWLVRSWILRGMGRELEAAKASETADRTPELADVLAQNLHLPLEIRMAIGLPDAPIEA